MTAVRPDAYGSTIGQQNRPSCDGGGALSVSAAPDQETIDQSLPSLEVFWYELGDVVSTIDKRLFDAALSESWPTPLSGLLGGL